MATQVEKDLSLTCEVCNKVFTNMGNLKAHRFLHFATKEPHDCPACGKMSITVDNFKKHSRPRTLEKYLCDFCKEAFSSPYNFKLPHDLLTKEKPCTQIENGLPYVCELCNKGFANYINLEAHRIVHIANKELYACLICKRTFIEEANQKKHHLTHEKLHVCDFCEKVFSHADDLKLHLHTHTKEKPNTPIENELPYVCELCNKGFAEISYLKEHRTVHIANKELHACHICRETFIEEGNLKKHYLTHEELHVCYFCGERYSFRRGVLNQYHANNIDPIQEIENYFQKMKFDRESGLFTLVRP